MSGDTYYWEGLLKNEKFSAEDKESIRIIYWVPRKIVRVFGWEMVADTKKVKRPQGWPNIDMLSLFRAGHTPMCISKSTRCRGIRCSDSIFFCFFSHTGQVKHFPEYVQPRLNVFSSSITDGSNGEARVNLWTLTSLVLRHIKSFDPWGWPHVQELSLEEFTIRDGVLRVSPIALTKTTLSDGHWQLRAVQNTSIPNWRTCFCFSGFF